jgi:hypothetical protein
MRSEDEHLTLCLLAVATAAEAENFHSVSDSEEFVPFCQSFLQFFNSGTHYLYNSAAL